DPGRRVPRHLASDPGGVPGSRARPRAHAKGTLPREHRGLDPRARRGARPKGLRPRRRHPRRAPSLGNRDSRRGGEHDLARPRMSAPSEPTNRGNFAKTPFAHVLVYMHDRRLTGSLVVEGLEGETTIRFDGGWPVAGREGGAGPAVTGDALRRIVFSLFRLGSAPYAYHDGVDLVPEAGSAPPLDPYPMILVGTREA